MSEQSAASALDAGCGVGFLTDLLAEQVQEVIGVDPSPESIAIARAYHGPGDIRPRVFGELL